MLKAYEVMTHPLATCAPEASVTDVAATMRDRDIGDVLIVEDGKLCGIVTDRDLTLQALTGQDDPKQTPVRKYMSTQVITGEHPVHELGADAVVDDFAELPEVIARLV